MGSGQIHDDHPNHHFFTPEGHLVSTKRLVYIVDQDDGLQRVCYNNIKFIYSEKATQFCEISTVDLTVTT